LLFEQSLSQGKTIDSLTVAKTMAMNMHSGKRLNSKQKSNSIWIYFNDDRYF